MKKLLLVVMAIFAIAVANAQTETKTTLVLKNGTEIRGVVLQEVPGEYITIKADSGDIFTYRMDEVQSGMNEKLNNQVQQQRALVAKREANKPYTGYRGIVELGGAAEISSGTAGFRASVNFVNGYSFSPHFYAGVGVGIAVHSNHCAIPLFANLRFSFLKDRKLIPYISLNVGYDISLTRISDDEYFNYYYYGATYSGYYLEPNIGIQIKRKTVRNKNYYWNIGISYTELLECWDDLHGIGLRVGLTF